MRQTEDVGTDTPKTPWFSHQQVRLLSGFAMAAVMTVLLGAHPSAQMPAYEEIRALGTCYARWGGRHRVRHPQAAGD